MSYEICGQIRFGLSVAENTCAWIVDICHRDTMGAANREVIIDTRFPSSHRRKRP